MGRRGPLAALLIALACCGASDALPIREARWTTPERRLAVLTTAPPECFVLPTDPVERQRALVGRVAFRTPLLLGGQAARAGLSCSSCHRSGRGNPDFVFPGLSDGPGTADVTASLMSSHRGDGQFNPKRIPDLAIDTPKVARAGDALPKFIHGLIVEEFDGPEPPSAVLDGVVAYVRALDPKACGRPMAVRMSRDLEVAREGARAAVNALRVDDPATARLMLSGARSALGRIDERLAGLAPERTALARLDASLLAIQLAIDRRDPAASKQIDKWLTALSPAAVDLTASERRSLYNPQHLARIL